MDIEQFNKLKHDIANPLAAVLAEVQLLLLDPAKLSPEVIEALKTVEGQALKIRTLIRQG